MSLGARLRELLDRREMTQTALAKKLGISASTLNGYVQDYREPDAKMLSRLAEELGSSVDYLVNGGDVPDGDDAYRTRVRVIAHSEGVELTREQEAAVARYMRFLLAEDQKEP